MLIRVWGQSTISATTSSSCFPLSLRDSTSFNEVITQDETAVGHTTHASMGNDLADYNNDGWLDLYVTDNDGANTLYRNNQDGTFTVSPLSQQVALADELSSSTRVVYRSFESETCDAASQVSRRAKQIREYDKE